MVGLFSEEFTADDVIAAVPASVSAVSQFGDIDLNAPLAFLQFLETILSRLWRLQLLGMGIRKNTLRASLWLEKYQRNIDSFRGFFEKFKPKYERIPHF